jgi:hypothetical protein
MHHRRRLLRLSGSLALGLGLAAAACSSPAKNVMTDAAALEAQGKLEEAAAKLEMGCALSPSAEPCPASDGKASETWQKAAEKAASEGRYRDAERLLHRALLTTADDAGKAKIRERIGKEDLAQGLLYERALGIADKAAAAAVMEDVAKHEAPAGAKAKEWLAKERPALLTAAVMAACGPEREGSCTKSWAALQASGAKGPDVDKAQAAAEAEERRVYPLRVQAEGFLPVFLGRYRKKEELAKCLSGTGEGETTSPEADCSNKVWNMSAEDRYDGDKNQDTLFRRTLKQIGDSALVADLEARRAAAETSGNHVKQDVPKPKPAPKKP